MAEWIYGWTEGWINELMDGKTDGLLNGWMVKLIDYGMDGGVVESMVELMNGWNWNLSAVSVNVGRILAPLKT